MKTKKQKIKKALSSKMKKQIILVILMFMTVFSYGQHTLRYNSKVQKKLAMKIYKDKKLSKYFDAWPTKNKNLLINNMTRFATFSKKDQKIALDASINCLVHDKDINDKEAKLIKIIIYSKSLKKKDLKRLLKRRYSSKKAKLIITSLVKNHLLGGKDAWGKVPGSGINDSDSAVNDQGFYRDVGVIAGAIVGGALAWEVGFVSGIAAGAAIGGAIGGLIDGDDSASDNEGDGKTDSTCKTPEANSCVGAYGRTPPPDDWKPYN